MRLYVRGYLVALLLVGLFAALLYSIMTDTLLFGLVSFLDTQAIILFDGIRSESLSAVMFFFTFLGNWVTVTILYVCLILGLLVFYERKTLLWFTGALFLGELAGYGIKLLSDRVRPDFVYVVFDAYGSAFPSGHTLQSTVLYAFIAYIAFRGIAHKTLRNTVSAIALLVPVCIGLSRVYLRVHWLSDVLGGWILGAAIVTCVISLVLHAEHHERLSFPRKKYIIAILIASSIILGATIYVIYATHPLRPAAPAQGLAFAAGSV